jgi:hypothetical protein
VVPSETHSKLGRSNGHSLGALAWKNQETPNRYGAFSWLVVGIHLVIGRLPERARCSNCSTTSHGVPLHTTCPFMICIADTIATAERVLIWGKCMGFPFIGEIHLSRWRVWRVYIRGFVDSWTRDSGLLRLVTVAERVSNQQDIELSASFPVENPWAMPIRYPSRSSWYLRIIPDSRGTRSL